MQNRLAALRPHSVKSLALCIGLAVAQMSSQPARATGYYWDENDAANGFGTAGTIATNWSSSTSLFTTSNTGATAVSGTQATVVADTVNFGTSTLGLGAGTINVNGSVTAASMTFGSSAATPNGAIVLQGGDITLNGSGNSVITVNQTTTVTINSNLNLSGGTNARSLKASAGANLIIGGAISNITAANDLFIDGAGSVTLSGTNTFAGNIQVASSAGGNGTLIASSIGNQTSTTSNLGSGTTIKLGASGNTGTLKYIGTGEVSNRLFTVAGNTAGTAAIIDQSGTGLLQLTGTFTSPGNLAKALTLRGSTSGTGEFAGIISDGAGTGVLSLTKAGTGTWTLSGANAYRGTTTVSGGTLKGTQNTGTPFGTGAVTITNSTLALAPGGTGGTPGFTGGTGAANTNFTYGTGATLSLDKGLQTRLTYTFGSALAGTAFARGTNGTLIISTTSIALLGDGATGERFIINSGSTAPTQVNGIVTGVVGQDRSASNAGDFLTYGATNGFAKATYTKTNDLTTSANTDIVEVIGNTNSSVASFAYAMKVGAATVINTGNTITLGDATAGSVANLILNGGNIAGGTLTTGATGSEYAIYVGSANGTISSAIQTASGSPLGMTVIGPGALDLSGSSGNSFSGGLRVNSSTVIVSNDNQLGNSTSVITLNGGTLQTSGTVGLGGIGGQRNIVLGIGQANSGGTFNVVDGVTTFTSSASKVISGTSLTKTGAGTLVLAGATANTYTGATIIAEGKLLVTGSISGSATNVNNGGTLGGTGSVLGITLNAGGAIEAGSTSDDLAATSLTWNGETSGAFAQMKFELSSVDNASDKLALSGALTKGTGSIFLFDFSGGAENTSYTLLTFGSQSGFIASDFSSTAGGLSGTFDLQGNALVFTTIPEPGSMASLFGGVVCLLGLRRFRRGVA